MTFEKGNIPWFIKRNLPNPFPSRRGIPLTKETKEKLSKSLKGREVWNKGKPWSEEAKMNMSKSHKGCISWNKGIKIDREKYPNMGSFGKRSEEFKKNMSIAKTGQKYPNRKPNNRSWTREEIKSRLRRRPMSSLEIKFKNIIEKNNMPYKFVGNGKFFIERKNPDFINCNGEKTAVEVFYTRHKNEFSGGAENWKAERIKIFAKYGWNIKFFNEVEVNEENIIKTLGGG